METKKVAEKQEVNVVADFALVILGFFVCCWFCLIDSFLALVALLLLGSNLLVFLLFLGRKQEAEFVVLPAVSTLLVFLVVLFVLVLPSLSVCTR